MLAVLVLDNTPVNGNVTLRFRGLENIREIKFDPFSPVLWLTAKVSSRDSKTVSGVDLFKVKERDFRRLTADAVAREDNGGAEPKYESPSSMIFGRSEETMRSSSGVTMTGVGGSRDGAVEGELAAVDWD